MWVVQVVKVVLQVPRVVCWMVLLLQSVLVFVLTDVGFLLLALLLL